FLATVAGTAGTDRFVYAIAGDNGNNPLRSVEFVSADAFGRPGMTTFLKQRNQLNTERTELGAARVGRYIYAIGGTATVGDSNQALQSVERAAILEPKDAPKGFFADVKFARTGGGVPGGIYYYRVAAVMSGEDLFNPNGENLASTAIGLKFPTVAGRKVQV